MSLPFILMVSSYFLSVHCCCRCFCWFFFLVILTKHYFLNKFEHIFHTKQQVTPIRLKIEWCIPQLFTFKQTMSKIIHPIIFLLSTKLAWKRWFWFGSMKLIKFFFFRKSNSNEYFKPYFAIKMAITLNTFMNEMVVDSKSMQHSFEFENFLSTILSKWFFLFFLKIRIQWICWTKKTMTLYCD